VGLPEVIEATAGTGQTERVVETSDRLAEATSAGGTEWGLGFRRGRARD
jgi:hypothetical protein